MCVIITSINLIPINGAIIPPSPYTSRFRRSKASAPSGRYFTPRKASGTSAMIISALKITAESIAECGFFSPITFKTSSSGNAAANIAGIIATYFATSFATEKVVSAPRVIKSCLPISTTSISFVGFESRSTMFPASFAACVPAFIAKPTSACANAGASLVPSPVIATNFPFPCPPHQFSLGCLAANQSQLVPRPRLRQKIVYARLARDRRRSQRIVAGNHHRANPHHAQVFKPLTHSALHDIFQMNHAQRPGIFSDEQRRPAGIRNAVHRLHRFLRHRPAGLLDIFHDRIPRALANLSPVHVDAGHARHCRKWNERRRHRSQLPPAQSVLIFRQHHDRTAFRRLVCQRRELRRISEFALTHARRRNEFRREAVSQSDRP